MAIIAMLLGQIPLPSIEQDEAFFKQEAVNKSLMLPVDYLEEHFFDVLDYYIDITVDIPNDTIWAEVTITSRILSNDLDTIFLHFDWPYTVESIREGLRDLEWSTDSRSNLYVAIGREIQVDDTIAISVLYHGKPFPQEPSGGLFIESEDNEYSVTYTECEPEGARNWFPCYDHPSDKATFTQRITVPSANLVVANGALEQEDKTGDWWSYTWQEHYPQATYLVAFAASKNFVKHDTFATIQGEKVPVSTWVLDSYDQSQKFESTPEILEYFSSIFPPYPFASEKYDHVHMNGWGMENTTCTFLNTLVNWGEPTWEWVIAHEMAHHWWGDWLTCGTWADIWLNEGFATYCEALWWENLYGDEGYSNYARYIMDFYLDNVSLIRPIYDPPSDDLFSNATTYKKGGGVLHMLRHVLGDSVFFAGLNQYGWNNANQSVITDDFQEATETISDQDLDWFFDEWIYHPGHPHYETGWKVKPPTWLTSTAYELEFAIAQTQNRQYHHYPFYMPMEIAIYHDGAEQVLTFTDSIGYQRFTIEVDYEPDSFVLDPVNKVLCEITYHDDIDDVPYPGIEEQPVTTDCSVLASDAIFTNNLCINFTNPLREFVTLSMHDASGRLVKSFYQGQSESFHGIYPLELLSSGVYFLRLVFAKGAVQTIKTVKIK
ncbi:T9SS type A sorting domain-containing protein [candidate division WOR-3 bacterium]|nr:T9SS type A sorting domain-containing protein [candidate division WOR-3 bacterium]